MTVGDDSTMRGLGFFCGVVLRVNSAGGGLNIGFGEGEDEAAPILAVNEYM